MLHGERAHRLYLIVGALHSPGAALPKQLWLDPDRKKLCVETSGFSSDRVEMAITELLLDIDMFIKQPLRGIRVHINCDCALVD